MNLASVYTIYNAKSVLELVYDQQFHNLVQNLGARRRNIHNLGARVSLG